MRELLSAAIDRQTVPCSSHTRKHTRSAARTWLQRVAERLIKWSLEECLGRAYIGNISYSARLPSLLHAYQVLNLLHVPTGSDVSLTMTSNLPMHSGLLMYSAASPRWSVTLASSHMEATEGRKRLDTSITI